MKILQSYFNDVWQQYIYHFLTLMIVMNNCNYYNGYDLNLLIVI